MANGTETATSEVDGTPWMHRRLRSLEVGSVGPPQWGCGGDGRDQGLHAWMTRQKSKPQFMERSLAPPRERLRSSLWCCACHRLMSRLASQVLLLAASPKPTFSKKGCLRASASGSRLDGSYSSMLSMRSKSWWCSSASDSKYRWGGADERNEKGKDGTKK